MSVRIERGDVRLGPAAVEEWDGREWLAIGPLPEPEFGVVVPEYYPNPEYTVRGND